MSSIYRLMMKKVGEEIREWDASYSHHWDSAIAGSSSLRAAVLRALLCENGAARGEHLAHMLWDKKKICDRVTLPLLAEELARRNYPKHLFVLGFFAHAAPRVLQVGKCLGPHVADCGNSMLAGCQQSVSFARGMLYKLVENTFGG